jgi:(p)ppGpp synthase/HD superfamily hydrolase
VTTPIEARDIAEAAHTRAGDTYGDAPYVIHLDAVAALVAPYGPEYEILAYLHDTVEDTDLELTDIERVFGSEIAACVGLLTDEPGHNRKTRKAATYAKLSGVGKDSIGAKALVVKTADRLANMSASIESKNGSLLKMYLDEHETFNRAAYRTGLCDDLWARIYRLVEHAETNGVRDL